MSLCASPGTNPILVPPKDTQLWILKVFLLTFQSVWEKINEKNHLKLFPLRAHLPSPLPSYSGFYASCRNWFQVCLVPCISCWGPGKEQRIGTRDCLSRNLISPNHVWEQGPKEGSIKPLFSASAIINLSSYFAFPSFLWISALDTRILFPLTAHLLLQVNSYSLHLYFYCLALHFKLSTYSFTHLQQQRHSQHYFRCNIFSASQCKGVYEVPI